jgi:hypothetical protein
MGADVLSGREPDVARRRWRRRRGALWCWGAAVSTAGLRSRGRSLRLFCLRWRFLGWWFLGRRLDLLLSLRCLLNMPRRRRRGWLLRGRRQLLWRRRRLCRHRQRLRRRDFSGGNRSDERGEYQPPRRGRVVRVFGDSVRRLTRWGRAIGRDRGDLASVVRAVGLHGCDDELVDGSGNSVGGIQPRERIFVVTVVSDQIHQIAHRHAAVEFGTRFTRRFDEAVRVVDRGNLFLAEEIEELLVLVRGGRGGVAGQNRRRDEEDSGYRGRKLTDDAGKHGRVSVLLKQSPGEPMRSNLGRAWRSRRFPRTWWRGVRRACGPRDKPGRQFADPARSAKFEAVFRRPL